MTNKDKKYFVGKTIKNIEHNYDTLGTMKNGWFLIVFTDGTKVKFTPYENRHGNNCINSSILLDFMYQKIPRKENV